MPDAILIAGPTASGKSRLALDLARQARRRRRQRRLHAGLRRAARPHGAAVASRTRRPRRIASTATFRRRRATRSARWLDDVAVVLAEARRAGQRADRRRRHRPLFQGADRGACGDPADPGGGARAGARRGRRPAVARHSTRGSPASDPDDAARHPPVGPRRASSARSRSSRRPGRSLARWQRRPSRCRR